MALAETPPLDRTLRKRPKILPRNALHGADGA